MGLLTCITRINKLAVLYSYNINDYLHGPSEHLHVLYLAKLHGRLGCYNTLYFKFWSIISVKAFNILTPRVHMQVTLTGWQEAVRAMENSSYFKSLEAKAKKQYCEKLSCVGLFIQDNPYLLENDEGFVNGLTTWPCTEFGHIFDYLVSGPGLYPQEELLSWKQLDAFNYMYFKTGYVRTVFSFGFDHAGKGLAMLKAKINPS